jgi:hypothetical protein
MKTLTAIVSVAACAAAVVALAGSAEARPRKYRVQSGEYIVVHPRSFTDSGVVVPVGSKNAYVQQMIRYTYQPYEAFSPGVLWRPEPYMFR